MRAKVLIVLGTGICLGWLYFYFLSNPSYMKSFEAKYYFYQQDFNRSLRLAKEAYKEDNYNQMAFTMLVQSTESLKWVKFINESREYLTKAKQISSKLHITNADRIEIRFMSEIVFDSYSKLNKKNSFIDDGIKNKAKYINDQLRKIYDEMR